MFLKCTLHHCQCVVFSLSVHLDISTLFFSTLQISKKFILVFKLIPPLQILIYHQWIWQSIQLNKAISSQSFHIYRCAQFQAIRLMYLHNILEMKNGDAFHPHMVHKSLYASWHRNQNQLLDNLLLVSSNSSLLDDQNIDTKFFLYYHYLNILLLLESPLVFQHGAILLFW